MQRKYKILLFVLTVLVDLADMVCDWFFYVDVKTSVKGLVYGKPNQAAEISLLVISIIGSLGFIIEIANLGIKLCSGEPKINIEFVGALIVWCEDLPQLGISIYIAGCREEAVSVFQIGKAVVIIISIVLRFFFNILRWKKKKENDSILSKCSRVSALVGLVVAIGCAVTVFVFTKAQRNKDGDITFKKPQTILEDRFDGQRYFKDVGMFFSLPAFDTSGHENTENWMRVAPIDSFLNSPDKDTLFLMEFWLKDNNLHIITQKNDNMDPKCYTIGQTNISNGNPCNITMNSEMDTNIYMFRFRFIPPAVFFRKMIFGDINFNIKQVTNGSCWSNVNKGDNIDEISLHYFRSGHAQDDHLVLESTGARFYKKDDLKDVQEVWKTGFFHCEPSGNLEPQLDTSIEVPCQFGP